MFGGESHLVVALRVALHNFHGVERGAFGIPCLHIVHGEIDGGGSGAGGGVELHRKRAGSDCLALRVDQPNLQSEVAAQSVAVVEIELHLHVGMAHIG